MRQINSTKLKNWDKPQILGDEKYVYDGENNIGFYWLQFDLYSIKCDAEHFKAVIELVDFWDSINATERYNYIKQYEDANGMKWSDATSLSMQFKKDFCLALFKLYEFMKPLDTNRFRDYINSDNVIRTDKNIYTTQCTQYNKKFSLVELQNYFIKEYQQNS